MLRATTISAGLARRARVILALAEGQSYSEIASTLGVTDSYIARWKQRVVAGGLPAPFTHWTTLRMGKLMDVSYVTVRRMGQRAGLKPHRLEGYLTSDDPDFETKAARCDRAVSLAAR